MAMDPEGCKALEVLLGRGRLPPNSRIVRQDPQNTRLTPRNGDDIATNGIDSVVRDGGDVVGVKVLIAFGHDPEAASV